MTAPEHEIPSLQHLAAAEHILNTLPDLLHTIRTEQNLTYRQIAEESGLTIPTVHQVHKRIRGCTTYTAAALIRWIIARSQPDAADRAGGA